MKRVGITIPIGIGDLLYIKGAFDASKHLFSEVKLTFNRDIINAIGRSHDYNVFLNDLGHLLFSEPPYLLVNERLPVLEYQRIFHGIVAPVKPELGYLLCKGSSLNIGEYIVMGTKRRYFARSHFDALSPSLWGALKSLSARYKIVVMGEREVEMNAEYLHHTSQYIYGIYDDIKRNVPADRLIDLTIPSLGITSPNLTQLQQDCLIMRNAKFVITIGIGGNFAMATSVAGVIGCREDEDELADMVFSQRHYPNIFLTRDWDAFIAKLLEHL